MPATSRSSSGALALDDWLTGPHAATHHARACGATPDDLWAAAQAVEVRETRSLRPVINWRLGRYAPSPHTPLSEVLAAHPFLLLGEEGLVSLSGLVGKLWSLGDTFVRLESGEEWREFCEPGYVKVLVRHEAREHERGAEIVSDVRLRCTNRRALWRFRPFWGFISPFTRYVGSEALVAAVRRAERSS